MPHNRILYLHHDEKCHMQRFRNVQSDTRSSNGSHTSYRQSNFSAVSPQVAQSMLNLSLQESEVGLKVEQNLSQSVSNLNEIQKQSEQEEIFPFAEAYKRIFQALFPKHRIHLFGSYSFGLSDDKSDLNIYIEFGKLIE